MVSSLDQIVMLVALSAAATKSRIRMDWGLAVELKLAWPMAVAYLEAL
jgi:hypothetical protein